MIYKCACGNEKKDELYAVSSESLGLKNVTMCRRCYYEWLKANFPDSPLIASFERNYPELARPTNRREKRQNEHQR